MATIAIVGPGAVGCVLAGAIQELGTHQLVLCGEATSRYEIAIQCWGGSSLSLSADIISDAKKVIAYADFVFVAVKSYETPTITNWLRNLCGPNTIVINVQNGIDGVDAIQKMTGTSPIVPAIVWWAAERISRSHIEVSGPQEISVPNTPDAWNIVRLFESSKIQVDPVDDFTTSIWRKICINAVAGIMPLVGCRAGLFRYLGAQQIARQFASECILIARAEGAQLDMDFADAVVSMLASLPKQAGTSILYDRMNMRPLEWDARNGIIQRCGVRHSIPTPISDFVVPLLMTISDICQANTSSAGEERCRSAL